jgi:prevent-host-death family protein
VAVRTTSLEEARAGLGELIDRARLAGEPTLITRYGRPAAGVVSEDWYRLAEESLTASSGTEALGVDERQGDAA